MVELCFVLYHCPPEFLTIMRKLTSVKAEIKSNPVKPKIVVKVDSNNTTKQQVNLKKSVYVTEPNNISAQQQHNSLNNIERLVEVPNTNTEILNKKFLKSISLNNGSSIQNRISKKPPIRNLNDSFWTNGTHSSSTTSSSTLHSSSPSFNNIGI